MAQDRSGIVAGIDVGGTFTDLVQLDRATGAVRLAKVATTPGNQAFGVMAALGAAGGDLAALDLIVHGTTTTTNAVLERKLSRTGLITTAGFRDVLELGRRTRPQAYGMTGQFTPVIPRDLRLEIPERMDAAGEVVIPLDEAALHAAARTLLDRGCEAVVVHFLHAYANPAHEIRAGEILAPLWPNDHVTLGHAILQESREFERGVTAAVNAAVQPILDRYLTRLRAELSAGGYRRDVLVMTGNGGMVSARQAAREAAKTVMSGPATGVMAAAYTGRVAGIENLITYDMGGTSTDVALIRGAEPAVSSEIEIEYAMPIHVPMVDVRTVGAGGGSIARVTAAGLLQVGPHSAGADPGPICYGRGGKEPTISDANLILGRLDPAKLPSTEVIAPAEVARRFAAPLGLDVTEAAQAVIRMANTHMAGAIRMVSLSLGADPRDFALFAFGGAGPLHAAALARELGVPRVLVPARPGITNAIGCVVADLRHDFVQTINTPVDALPPGRIAGICADHVAEGEALIAGEGVEIRARRHIHSVDMQFTGQTHLLRVPLESPEIDAPDLRARFEAAYFDRFRVRLSDIRAQVVNVNTSVVGVRPALDLSTLIDPAGRKPTLAAAQTGTRRVHFAQGWIETPVYWRDHLPLDAHLQGPAIVEQMDTTILIEPGDSARGDAHGNLILTIGGARP
ncbi:hydantoinase/oxoprolinase family protein [Roseovarius aestuariivivens]|uniref:hydantoinase/oxoprolinase family protein n=1 Tax=Roseovarius aestuariivivens TaxID=1888910 RepID=UPI001080BB19|nr:hydantoinase/oxoprolinase family protein [Roseovarius aestuariivivens]